VHGQSENAFLGVGARKGGFHRCHAQVRACFNGCLRLLNGCFCLLNGC